MSGKFNFSWGAYKKFVFFVLALFVSVGVLCSSFGKGTLAEESVSKVVNPQESEVKGESCSPYEAVYSSKNFSEKVSRYYQMEIEKNPSPPTDITDARVYFVIRGYDSKSRDAVNELRVPFFCYTSGACGLSLTYAASGKYDVFDYVSLDKDFSWVDPLGAIAPHAYIVPGIPPVISRRSLIEVEGGRVLSNSDQDDAFMSTVPSVWIFKSCKKNK